MSWRRWPWKTPTSSAFNMRATLHILTRPDDALARGVIATLEKHPDAQLKVVDLAVPQPDYAKLLEEIFAADSVAVW